VLGIILLVVAMFVVIRWHHSVNYARTRLMALDVSIDGMSDSRMSFAGVVVST
jgi:hypothetical protein